MLHCLGDSGNRKPACTCSVPIGFFLEYFQPRFVDASDEEHGCGGLANETLCKQGGTETRQGRDTVQGTKGCDDITVARDKRTWQ